MKQLLRHPIRELSDPKRLLTRLRTETHLQRALLWVGALVIVAYALNALHQNDTHIEATATTAAVTAKQLQGAVEANCDVLRVLVQQNATPEQTKKLFAGIRAQNPETFDRLVERSVKRTEKLAKVGENLSCRPPIRIPR